ncbi:RHS repeat-associated core domain-containing protein [Stenotrophomonas bentonitica]|uniref:RHS repeat-associated core domain-containing protein n=1 Tax=Stenotrophomonas bentonitica TaxID=1450134 RepID=UPI00345E53B4
MDSMLTQQYCYDATGVLVGMRAAGRSSDLFWRGRYPANALRRQGDNEARVTWLREAGRPMVEETDGGVARCILLATDAAGSVLLEADAQVRTATYAPHGHRNGGVTTAAFNGELCDDVSGCYLLGAGHHRPYSPVLGVFLAPDRASPFGAGGLNTLAWCAGDPINFADPSGHFLKWILAGVGIALGVVAVVTSFGAASAAVGALAAGGIAALTKSGAGAIAALTLGVSALGTETGAIIAGASGDHGTAEVLGWVGLGLGLVGAAPAIAKGAGRLLTRFTGFTRRIDRIRRVGLSGDGAISAGRQMARRQSTAPPARRASMAAPAQRARRAPIVPGSSSGRSASTFVGYHGTSGANAEKILSGGADSLYVTDRYGSAAHYASRGENGVVLAMYADDVDALRVTQRPAVNGKGIAEAITTNTRLRAVKVTDPGNAPPMHDFIDFYMGRQLGGDDILAQLRQMNGDAEMDSLLRRHGMLSSVPE